MPSIAEPPTLPLSQDEMAAINRIMNRNIRMHILPTDDDTAEWKLTLEMVVKALVSELSTTVSKANFIPFQDVQELIEKLNDDEVKEWQSELKALACEDKANWSDLVSHRKFQVYRI